MALVDILPGSSDCDKLTIPRYLFPIDERGLVQGVKIDA